MIVDYVIVITGTDLFIAVGWYLAHAIFSGAGPDKESAIRRMSEDFGDTFKLGEDKTK
jgi:hypothetical protein